MKNKITNSFHCRATWIPQRSLNWNIISKDATNVSCRQTPALFGRPADRMSSFAEEDLLKVRSKVSPDDIATSTDMLPMPFSIRHKVPRAAILQCFNFFFPTTVSSNRFFRRPWLRCFLSFWTTPLSWLFFAFRRFFALATWHL